MLNSYSSYFGAGGDGPISQQGGLSAPASASWGTANLARILPFQLPFPYLVVRLFWWNGSALGNADIGIYSLAGGKIYSSGSTVQSGGPAPQFVTPSTSILLPPGSYFLALANDGSRHDVLFRASLPRRILEEGSRVRFLLESERGPARSVGSVLHRCELDHEGCHRRRDARRQDWPFARRRQSPKLQFGYYAGSAAP
jgi:hypothetical protein